MPRTVASRSSGAPLQSVVQTLYGLSAVPDQEVAGPPLQYWLGQSGKPDPSQYWSGGPATSWSGTALSPYKVWTTDWSGAPEDLDATVLGIYSRYAEAMGDPQGTTHFVIDTSRNGQGPWDWAAAGYSDAGTAQDWCNPPGRGLGIAPTTDTENDLVDAYLWIKVPGVSDGSCTRVGSTGDMGPERGIV